MFDFFRKLTNPETNPSDVFLDVDSNTETQSSPIDVCISYGGEESFWAKVIEKSFCDLNQRVLSISQSRFLRTEFLSQPRVYVSFLPDDYGQLSLEKRFDEEILKALSFIEVTSLLLVCDVRRNNTEAVQSLVRSIELTRSDVSVNTIDISLLREESLITITDVVKELVNMCCTNADETISKLMTSSEKLVTVRSNDSFSDLYYRMIAKGVRHIPILAPDSDLCLGIVSRRDIADQLPPSNEDLDQLQDSLPMIDRARLNRILLAKGMEKISSVFPHLGGGGLVHLSPESKIEEAISKLCDKQRVGRGRLTYVSGILVLDENGILKGFVSYTDILRKFIKYQEDFMNNLTVDQVALMGSEKIDCLNDEMKLSLAKMIADGTQRRSFPVLANDEPEESIVVGFLEDIQIKKYLHPEFPELDSALVSEIMTRVNNLPCIPGPTDKISDVLDKFSQPFYGSSPASSFPVCQESGGQKKLRGVISYVDILKHWQKWYDNQLEEV